MVIKRGNADGKLSPRKQQKNCGLSAIICCVKAVTVAAVYVIMRIGERFLGYLFAVLVVFSQRGHGISCAVRIISAVKIF